MNEFNTLDNQQTNNFPEYHTHNGSDGTPKLDEQLSVTNTRKHIIYRLVNALADTAVSTSVGGDFVMPFNGYVLDLGATVDTAGVTGTTTIDINRNGATILTTKITIDTTEKTSRTATTLPVIGLNLNKFEIGDIYTFDIDAINSGTVAKGLSVFMNVVKTS